MDVREIRKRRNYYTVLFVVYISLSAYFFIKLITLAAIVFAVMGFALLTLLIRQNRLVFDATLIWDNRILTVPSAVFYLPEGKGGKEAEETIVSTFGLLIGSKIYKWGSEGIRGVRLSAIKIDRAWLCLSFGDGAHTMRVELLHGMADKQEAKEVQKKFRRETGVTATISGWGTSEKGNQ